MGKVVDIDEFGNLALNVRRGDLSAIRAQVGKNVLEVVIETGSKSAQERLSLKFAFKTDFGEPGKTGNLAAVLFDSYKEGRDYLVLGRNQESLHDFIESEHGTRIKRETSVRVTLGK